MQSLYMQDENGMQISYEEWEFRNKYIPYKDYEWPKPDGVNAILFKSTFGSDNHIQNYRYPVQVG